MWLTGKSRTESGFSLLEILVAFIILSLAIGVLLRIFAGGGYTAKTAEDYYRAVITAESMLESIGVDSPLQPGVIQGLTETGIRWTISVTPYPLDPRLLGGMEGAPNTTNNLGYLPYWVDVNVEWGPEEDPRAFELTTMRIIPDKSQNGFQ